MSLNALNDRELQRESNNNFGNYDESDSKRKQEELGREKDVGKKSDAIACFIKKAELLDDKEVLEYLKLFETNPEQIEFWEFAEDLNKGEGFTDDIKKKLKSNLVDSVSSDVIYEEYSSSLKEMPFMTEVLNIKDFDLKKKLLNEVLQEQEAINNKYYDEKGLDELSDTLGEESVDYVFKDEKLSILAEGWEQLQAPLRLYLANKIVQNLSNKFGINPPHIVDINFGEQDFTMGSKGVINLNLNSSMFSNFHDFITVLLHEFTHCLQDNYKTPGGEGGIKEAKKYYFNGITGDERLNDLGREVHDSSLLEKEAFYVQAKIKERVLKK